MLIARVNGLWILGLDAENIKRLQAGQPIMKSLAEVSETDIDICIMYGNTVQDIVNYIEKETGLKMPEQTAVAEKH
jgi:hypothetical protein